MNRRIILMLFFFTLCACSTHQYRIEGDQMTLILRYPDAKNVVLFCSLDGFKPRVAQKKSNIWESELPAGTTFRYFYQVDGTPFVPECPMKEEDDFGFKNCIYEPRL